MISRGALAMALVSGTHAVWAAPAPAPAPEAAVDDTEGEVIVTGTRLSGFKASDSPAPIQLLGSDALKRVGQADLNAALAQQLPSIQVQAFGSDQTAMHPSIKLRGLSPNHTLVEINGKRRHGTSNVSVAGGPFGGGAAPDLGLIPQAAIDHVEVLMDGAAAQYGTDAIAGVVNLILKKNTGLNFDATGGKYIDQGGKRYDIMGRIGVEPFENAYISLTAQRTMKDYSFRGDVDPRVSNTAIASVATLLRTYPLTTSFANYPYVNRIVGDGHLKLTNGLYNAGYEFSPGFSLYSFGTYSHKVGRTFQNYRLPNVVVGKSATDIPFPAGFSPQELTRETDYAATGGIKGTFAETTFDLSTTYGKDVNNIYVDGSANAALYYDTSTLTSPGYSPRLFFDGAFVATQWSNTLDLGHAFDVGMASPLNVAAGLEYRRETYILRAGDPSSYYISPYAVNPTTGVAAKQGGAQSFFGYAPANASNNSRKNWSQYLDLSLKPVDAWLIDAAVRHEHYSDFGNTTVWKVTSRYDFTDAIAVRGTASSGFRAPTLAEGFYSGINVGPTSLSGVFAPNSAGAKSLGLSGLRPEKSTNFSAGFVAKPIPRMTFTVDGYYIKITNRIVQSGSFFGANVRNGVDVVGTATSPSVLTALRAAGVPVDSVLATLRSGQTGSIALQTFVNGVDTRTTGIDAVLTYASDFGNAGHVDWSLTANYNKTKILKVNAPPSAVNQAALLLDPSAQSNLTDTTPKFRATAGAYWAWNKVSLNLRESFYGVSSLLVADPTSGLYVDRLKAKSKFITDIEAGYQFTKWLKLSAGANNVFNVYPTKYPDYYRNQFFTGNSSSYVTKFPTWSPIGINGGYYYGRLSVTF
jgi:iron complex outermembrane receptor protein